MTVIATILGLLPIYFAEYQEGKLIGELNNFFNFDHNVFLLDSSVDRNRYIDIRRREVTPQSVYVSQNVDDNFTELKSLTEINSKNTFIVVVLPSSNFCINLNLLNGLKEVQ